MNKRILAGLCSTLLFTLACSEEPAEVKAEVSQVADKAAATVSDAATAVADGAKEAAAAVSDRLSGSSTPETEEQKFSYALGFQYASQIHSVFKQSGIEADADALKTGISDAFADKEPRVSVEEMQSVMQSMQQRLQLAMQAKQTADTAEAQKLNEAFLAENAKAEGVKVTESGLQYKVLKPAEGASPTAESEVTVHYMGTLLDGTVFDSSYKRGEAATFKLNEVVPGWTEGVQLMQKGSKYRLWIPPQLGYGARASGAIKPNSLLIFDLELLDIK